MLSDAGLKRYGGGERSPLYNRLCMNRGYAIFAADGSGRSYTAAADSLALVTGIEPVSKS